MEVNLISSFKEELTEVQTGKLMSPSSHCQNDKARSCHTLRVLCPEVNAAWGFASLGLGGEQGALNYCGVTWGSWSPLGSKSHLTPSQSRAPLSALL